ncbi:hypothetical protein [Prochlorococcus marinus]|uniref:Uncharacterized protein n=1 Tax=Prochlorococcus marinus (strain MIT 9211) TaxID=93059 RepID=A9BAA1_PROM4|nr:hypothetical protein [Prochlorococcus marinus]ABX08763.1 Hypothetical protein P9211_08321 [Prochlorococcus marinus str. MIT 9211]
MRLLTTETRRRLEALIDKISLGDSVSLKERIELDKYSKFIPFVAGKVNQALRKRKTLEEEGLI